MFRMTGGGLKFRRRRLAGSDTSVCCCTFESFCMFCAVTLVAGFLVFYAMTLKFSSVKDDQLMKMKQTHSKTYHCEHSLETDNTVILNSPAAKSGRVDCQVERYLSANGSCHANLAAGLLKHNKRKELVSSYKSTDFRRVILVVSYNEPHSGAISRVHRLYQGLFFKVIHCVTSLNVLKRTAAKRGAQDFLKLINVTVFEFSETVTSPPGAISYLCVPIVYEGYILKFKYSVDGILHISDDMIPALWNFRNDLYSLDKNWILTGGSIFDVDSGLKCSGRSWQNPLDCIEPDWPIWQGSQDRMMEAMDELEAIYPDFADRIAQANFGHRRVRLSYAGLFYITAKSIPQVSELFAHFGKYKALMDLVVGTILQGVSGFGDGNNGQDRASDVNRKVGVSYQLQFIPQLFTIKPFKMSGLKRHPLEKQCIYCQLVMKMDILRERHPSIC